MGEEINLGIPVLNGRNVYIESIDKVTNNGIEYDIATIKSKIDDLNIIYR